MEGTNLTELESKLLDSCKLNCSINHNTKNFKKSNKMSIKGRNRSYLLLNKKDDAVRKKRNQLRSGRWSISEHLRLIKGVLLHENKWSKIKEVVQSRSTSQIRSHTQKYLLSVNNAFAYKLDPLNASSVSSDAFYSRKSIIIVLQWKVSSNLLVL